MNLSTYAPIITRKPLPTPATLTGQSEHITFPHTSTINILILTKKNKEQMPTKNILSITIITISSTTDVDTDIKFVIRSYHLSQINDYTREPLMDQSISVSLFSNIKEWIKNNNYIFLLELPTMTLFNS